MTTDHETIEYAMAPSALGIILVAASAKGILAILLGDDPDSLVRDLQAGFPKARLAPGAAARLAQVMRFIETPAHAWDLPLDLRGTTFQQQVWQALLTIPAGTTATYGDIARRIGAPAAIRAVAGACAANRLAMAIPCHRVIRHDGGLSGYRWGAARKRALLAREAQA